MGGADDWLPLSGIQHFCFCRRQWALIHLEQLSCARSIQLLLLPPPAHPSNSSGRRTAAPSKASSTTPAAMTQTRPNGAAACSSPEGCRWSAVGWA